MRYLTLSFFVIAFVLSLLALSYDIANSLNNDTGLVFNPLGKMVTEAGLLKYLGLLQVSLERYVSPSLWWYGVEPLLHMPGSFVSLSFTFLTGMIFWWSHRRYIRKKYTFLAQI